MNITLAADEALVKKARKRARSEGLSLNAFIRAQMERMVGGKPSEAADEFLKLVREHPGRPEEVYRFDREEAHRR